MTTGPKSWPMVWGGMRVGWVPLEIKVQLRALRDANVRLRQREAEARWLLERSEARLTTPGWWDRKQAWLAARTPGESTDETRLIVDDADVERYCKMRSAIKAEASAGGDDVEARR